MLPTTDFSELHQTSRAIADAMSQVIDGKPEVIQLALTVLLAEGHLLIEDVPGVGKTTLAKALAAALHCSISRIQFTPDLLPSDVTGNSIYQQDRGEFEFKPGAIFAHFIIADEINRASPKTQSALLECMEEKQVTVDGSTYQLETPFIVMATQNPLEMEGTYPLPEAQRDRFMAQISMGYPDPVAELAMLAHHGGTDPLTQLRAVATAHDIGRLIELVRTVWVSQPVAQYLVELATATRRSPELRLGASPRALLHLLRAVRAHAALLGRDHVLPDDVQALADPVLSHRLLLTSQAQMSGRTSSAILLDIIRSLPIPTGTRA